MQKVKKLLFPGIVFALFYAAAVASMAPKQSYQPQPRPCITHAPITTSPLLLRVYISGSYTMKDLSGAQVSGRDYFVRALNYVNPYKYQLADGVNPYLTFTITINEYSGYFGATVDMSVTDGKCFSKGKSMCCCNAFKRFETTYVTPNKLYDDIASKFNSFITGGWCSDCPSPCNPYGY